MAGEAMRLPSLVLRLLSPLFLREHKRQDKRELSLPQRLSHPPPATASAVSRRPFLVGSTRPNLTARFPVSPIDQRPGDLLRWWQAQVYAEAAADLLDGSDHGATTQPRRVLLYEADALERFTAPRLATAPAYESPQ